MSQANPITGLCLVHGGALTRLAVLRMSGSLREHKIFNYRSAYLAMKLIGCAAWKVSRTAITPNGVTIWMVRDSAEQVMKPKYRMVVYNHLLEPIGVEEFNDMETMRKRAKGLYELYYATQVFVLNGMTGKYEALVNPQD